MNYPGTSGGVDYGMGGGGDAASSLEQRKRQLIQSLANRNAVSGNTLFSGRQRSSSDLPSGHLPSLTFNPFLAQIAGRNENFPQLPAGVSALAAQAVQAGPGPVMGGGPARAASAALGGGLSTPASPPPMTPGGGSVPAPSPAQADAPRWDFLGMPGYQGNTEPTGLTAGVGGSTGTGGLLGSGGMSNGDVLTGNILARLLGYNGR